METDQESEAAAAAGSIRSRRNRNKTAWLKWVPDPLRLPTPKLRFIAGLPKNPRVLDLGTLHGGSARLVRRLHPESDLHAADLEDCSGYLHDLNATFQRFDATSAPFPYEDDYFDAVIFAHVIEHLPERGALLQEVHRILKPGGTFYVETPNLRRLFVPSLKLGLDGPEPIKLNFRDDYTHVTLYTHPGLYFLLRDSGFDVYRHGTARNRVYLMFSPLIILCAYLFRNRRWLVEGLHALIGASCYCAARKPTKM